MPEPLKGPVAIVLLLAACGSVSPSPTPGADSVPGGPGDQGEPGAATAPADAPSMPAITGGPDIGDLIPSFPAVSLYPESASRVSATLRGETFSYPFVAECVVSTERVAILASNQEGTGGVSLQWLASDPAGTVATLSNVSADRGFVLTREGDSGVPQVTVQDDTAQLVLEAVEMAFGNRDPEVVTIIAKCVPPTTVKPQPEPTRASAGRATVRIGDQTLDFSVADTCVIDQNQVTAQFDEGDRILTIIASGGAAFMNVTVGENAWSVGLGGDPMQFQVSGSTATWSGEISDVLGGKFASASVTVECNQ